MLYISNKLEPNANLNPSPYTVAMAPPLNEATFGLTDDTYSTYSNLTVDLSFDFKLKK